MKMDGLKAKEPSIVNRDRFIYSRLTIDGLFTFTHFVTTTVPDISPPPALPWKEQW